MRKKPAKQDPLVLDTRPWDALRDKVLRQAVSLSKVVIICDRIEVQAGLALRRARSAKVPARAHALEMQAAAWEHVAIQLREVIGGRRAGS